MSELKRFARVLLLAGCCIALGAAAIVPEPSEIENGDGEVDATALFSLVVNLADDAVKSVRYGWTFDARFSAAMIEVFDDDGDQTLDRSELQNASQSFYETIQQYHYFLMAERDGKPLPMTPPARLPARFDDGRLTLSFEAQPVLPLPLSGNIAFGVYDPTLSVDFGRDGELSVDPTPVACEVKTVRPDLELLLATHPEALAKLSEDADGSETMRLLANRIELTCP